MPLLSSVIVRAGTLPASPPPAVYDATMRDPAGGIMPNGGAPNRSSPVARSIV
jgi:hypothetical protein